MELIFAGGGSRKGSRSTTPIIEEESTSKSPKLQQEEPTHLKDDDRQRTQPTVIEPVEQELPGFNIDDFLGDIIGYPGKPSFCYVLKNESFRCSKDNSSQGILFVIISKLLQTTPRYREV